MPDENHDEQLDANEDDKDETDDGDIPERPVVRVDHLLERIPPSKLGLVGHLEAAEALVSRAVLQEVGEADSLAECRRSGYHHMWLATLQQVGISLGEQDRDDVLPVEYWHHLMWAAAGMEYPEMIPYMAGKAERRPRRVWEDVLVSIVVLDRKLPEPLRVKRPDAVASMRAYVDWLESLDASHAELFRDADPKALHARFMEEDILAAEPHTERFDRINRDFQAMFYDVFALVTDPELPDDLKDVAWSVIDVNYFIVDASGLVSFAEVWWRF